MVPLKDLVVFPRMVVPFFVGRRRSVRSVEEASRLGRPLFLVAQKKTAVEEPGEHDVHAVGTIARVLQMTKLPDGKIRLLVEGLERAAVVKYTETHDCLQAVVRSLPGSRDHAADLGAHADRALPVQPVQRDDEEGPRGGGDRHRGRRFTGCPRGPRCGKSSPEVRAEAGAPVHGGRDGAPGAVRRHRRLRDRAGQPRAGDHRQGPAEAGEDPEGLLPQRAAQGDPEGAGRRGRRSHRGAGARGEGEDQGPSRRGGREVPEGAQAARTHAAPVPGIGARCARTWNGWWTFRGRKQRRTTGTSSRRGRSWTRITTT